MAVRPITGVRSPRLNGCRRARLRAGSRADGKLFRGLTDCFVDAPTTPRPGPQHRPRYVTCAPQSNELNISGLVSFCKDQLGGSLERLTIRAMWLVGGDQLADQHQAPALPWPTSSGRFDLGWSEERVRTDNHRYGYHVPRTEARDNHYIKLEAERAAEKAQ